MNFGEFFRVFSFILSVVFAILSLIGLLMANSLLEAFFWGFLIAVFATWAFILFNQGDL